MAKERTIRDVLQDIMDTHDDGEGDIEILMNAVDSMSQEDIEKLNIHGMSAGEFVLALSRNS